MRREAQQEKRDDLVERYAIERRRQLAILLVLAATILLISVLVAGVHNVFLPHWWRIDLP